MKYSKMLNTIPAFLKGLFKTCLFFRENFISEEVIIGGKLAGPGDKNSLKH